MRKVLSAILSIIIVFTSLYLSSNTVNASSFEKIKDAATDAAEKAGTATKEAAEKAGAATKETFEKAGAATKETAEKAGAVTKDTVEKAGAATKEATQKAETVTKDAAEKAKDTTNKAGEYISNEASKAYNSASSAASEASSNIKEYISNIDTEKFKSGWDYASKYAGVAVASLKGQAYVNTVQKTIADHSAQMQSHLNSKVISNRSIAQDAGFAAEIWHTDTFNLEAALNGSEYKAIRPDSNAKASADITVTGNNYSQDYSGKYYKDATSSASAQAKTYLEDYREYVAHAQRHGETPMSEKEYLAQYDKSLDSLYDSLYAGQGKLIPTDQLDDAKAYLSKRKAKMSASESLERQKFSPELQETLDSLGDRISSPDGTQSKPLTEAEAKQLVELTRDGDLDLADFGITPAQLVTPTYILKQAINSGSQAAIISIAFEIGPDVYTILVDAAKDGKIDEAKLKEVGIEGVLAGTEGFVEGSVSSAIVIACQSGKFGAAYTNIAPETVGTLSVLTIDAIRFGYQLSTGQITEAEYADIMAEDIIIAIASQASGALLQALFPFLPFAYVAGSMAGAMLASAGYTAGKEIILEMRGENGFETVVPETIASGKSLADDVMQNINLKNIASDFKNLTVSTLNNGKIAINLN